MSRKRLFRFVLTLSVLGSGLWACSPETQKPRMARPGGTLGGADAPAPSLALEGTVGSVAYVQGIRLMRVKGYSLVVGLEGTGSSQCPTSVRDLLIKEIRRMRDTSAYPSEWSLPAPEVLIDSMDTAVVEVVGEVPAGAAKGRGFDVYVAAVDPDVRSLWGGRMLPCELRIYQEVEPARVLEGRVHGRASGPVFINPFRELGSGEGSVDLLSGTVIGGGTNQVPRRLRLICTVESYAVVQRIAESVNRRFGNDPKIADPVSPTNIELTVPHAYRGREGRFLDLITHLPLSLSSAEREARAKLLVGEFSRPDVSLSEVGLALEGVGKVAIPFVQELYADARRDVSYHAARTGLRLGDELAVDVIVRHATDSKSPFQRVSIRELGYCTIPHRTAHILKQMIDDEDPRIRILAYEALRNADPGNIAQVLVGALPGNFMLDVVPSNGPGLVYAHRQEARRLALIGGDRMICSTPMFYSRSDRPLTITAKAGDGLLTLMLKVKDERDREKNLGPYRVSPVVPTLAQFLGNSPERGRGGGLKGLGMDYAEVLEVLHTLCSSGMINADMRWQEPDIEEVVGPLRPIGRPESDL